MNRINYLEFRIFHHFVCRWSLDKNNGQQRLHCISGGYFFALHFFEKQNPNVVLLLCAPALRVFPPERAEKTNGECHETR